MTQCVCEKRQRVPRIEGPDRVTLDGPVRLRRGGVLERVDIACERWGALTPARDNVVLLFTGLSPGPHAASGEHDPSPGWWEFMVGPGRPIDTNRYHVVCVNSLGSCHGSTGPASINPATGEPYRLAFPALSVEDIAVSAHAALLALGLERPHAVVGASLGGMSALAYALLFPEHAERLVSISSAASASSQAIALRSLQREIIRNDPAWRAGDYDPARPPLDGMRLARKLGLMSYRSGEEWEQRFGHQRANAAMLQRVRPADAAPDPFAAEFQIETYLEANAQKFIHGFDANSYLYLSRAMDWFDAAEHGEGSGTEALLAALGRIQAHHSLIVGVESDSLFPLWQQRELADTLRALDRRVDFVALPSVQGHDAFLVDEAGFAPVLRAFFAEA